MPSCRLASICCFLLTGTICSAAFRLSLFFMAPPFHHHRHHHHHHPFNPPWARPALRAGHDITIIPSTFPGTVIPLDCHSHNDYDRQIPLFEALHHGCTSVEADVWLVKKGADLLLGHSHRALERGRSLASIYIHPILQMLDQRNPVGSAPRRGLFDMDPARPLVLLVDLKTNGYETFPALQEELAPLRSRGYLTHYNGSQLVEGLITIVATGNAPFDLLTRNQTYRDIFFDAPLARIWEDQHQGAVATSEEIHAAPPPEKSDLGQGLTGLQGVTNASVFTPENSYYASLSYKAVLNHNIPPVFPPNQKQARMMRQMIESAHAQGLRVRFWGGPSWPRWYRDRFWAVATKLGADMMNVDEPAAFQRGFWQHTELTLDDLGGPA